MEVGSICSREVDTVTLDETVQVAARRMLQRSVGSLVVVDADQRPRGIVTDRDLALRVLAPGLSSTSAVSGVMTPDPQCVSESHILDAALNKMVRVPCRRLPVLSADGVLVGIVTLDDIHEYHAEAGAMMSVVLRRENPVNQKN